MTCVEVNDREGGAEGKCPLGVLIMALLLPLAVTIPKRGQDKRKPMFHLRCLGISNSVGSKRRETAGCLFGGWERKPSDASLFSLILASFAAVFKIRCLNKKPLDGMKVGGEKKQKRHNFITVTVLSNELKAYGSDLLFVYCFVVERYM